MTWKNASLKQIESIPWFDALEAPEQQAVARLVSVNDVAPNQVICKAGDRPAYWIGVLSGLVKMSGYAANGKTVTFAGFPAGGWFGEGTILKNLAYQYDIQALQPSTLAYLPVGAFHDLLATSVRFNQYLLRQFNERLGQFIGWKAAEQTMCADRRLAQALWTLFGHPIYSVDGARLKISQQELAYLVGTTRQQVNEALQALRHAGAAKPVYGGVELISLERLRDFANIQQ